jgi:hypothetical protein
VLKKLKKVWISSVHGLKKTRQMPRMMGESIPGFLPSLMDTYTWGMPKVFALILE